MKKSKSNTSKFLDQKKQSTKPRGEDELKLVRSIGLKLRSEIVKNETNVDRLAVDSETSRGTVRRILSGKENVTILSLDRIAKSLGYKNAVDFLMNL